MAFRGIQKFLKQNQNLNAHLIRPVFSECFMYPKTAAVEVVENMLMY